MSASEANTWIPLPLRKLGGRALASALNRVLALDPESQAALAKLEGRRLAMRLCGPEITFAIAVREGRLEVGPPDARDAVDPNAKSDLHVSATPGAVLSLLAPRADDALPPGKIEIAGDAELARRVEKLARGFAPDFEAAIVSVLGEIAGVPIARALREATRWLQTGARHFGEDAADWLRDEARLVVPRGELDDFLDGVDALRERVERLAARVQRLAERHA